MARIELLALLMMVMSGCASISRNPVDISCSGKGQITGTGYAGMTVAVGGHEANTFTLTADCGTGFTYHAGPAK